MSMLDEATASLASDLHEELGELICYEGDGDRCYLRAIANNPQELVDETTGKTLIAHDDLDWIIYADDLILAGRIACPKSGHRITKLSDHPSGSAAIYEVLPRNNAQCWKRNDPQGAFITIHTKRIMSA